MCVQLEGRDSRIYTGISTYLIRNSFANVWTLKIWTDSGNGTCSELTPGSSYMYLK